MPKCNVGTVLVLAAALAAAERLSADAWDLQTQNDDTLNTENELVHGSDQLHDLAARLGVADKDYYRLRQDPYASYEIVVDATSGDIVPNPPDITLLSRVDSTGAAVQNSQAISTSIGFSLSLRWQNSTGGPPTINTHRIFVLSKSCTTTCTVYDAYRIRAFETTYAIARLNNAGGQSTTVVIQNPTTYSVNGTLWYWNGTGGLIASRTFTIAAKAVFVWNTTADAPGGSGSMTISSDARYGDLSGKAVAVEPSTGFTFDTPMVLRAR